MTALVTVMAGCAAMQAGSGGTTLTATRTTTSGPGVPLSDTAASKAPLGDCSGDPPAVPAGPVATALPSARTSTEVPAELVGAWCTSDGRSAELTYRFNANGTYAFRGIIWQERPTGPASFEAKAWGLLTVEQSFLELTAIDGSETLIEPNDTAVPPVPPSTSVNGVDTDAVRLRWLLTDNESTLSLTDAQDRDVTYHAVDP